VVGIALSIDIDAPVAAVWNDLANLASHAEWMVEAESIEFVGEIREGAGAILRVVTRVGPFRTVDVIEVTVWEPPFVMGVHHRGTVAGSGRFSLDAISTGTRFTWSETLAFPWLLGGQITAFIARPVLRAIWERNLERFRKRF